MRFGAGVGKTVSKIQSSRVSTPSKFLETFDGSMSDHLIDCDFLYVRTPEELFELPLGVARRDINFRR